MNERVKKLWVNALRSGEYKQTFAKLYDSTTGGFCCLGVLCDLYKKDTGLSVSMTGGFLPEKVYNWAGLREKNPAVTIPELRTSIPLAYVNDGWRDVAPYLFKEIADLIEDYL